MNSTTKFLKMFYKLPERARNLVYKPYSQQAMTLTVIAAEVKANTELSKMVLKDLGFNEDRK